jgi:hypothetical protein
MMQRNASVMVRYESGQAGERGTCKACGAPVVAFFLGGKGKDALCDPQRRLVIFDEELPAKPLVLLEEFTCRVVRGRPATQDELERFKKEGNPGKPYTIGRGNHLRTCTGRAT